VRSIVIVACLVLIISHFIPHPSFSQSNGKITGYTSKKPPSMVFPDGSVIFPMKHAKLTATPEVTSTPRVTATPRLQSFSGVYSGSGNFFKFHKGGSFTYLFNVDGNVEKSGALERSSCALTSTKTDKVISQGNHMFYLDGTSCCYAVKYINRFLILDRVWAKENSRGDQYTCPNFVLSKKNK
jgi:hypothetical protein